ncbi:MAG: hypothetical protein IKT44_03745 [Clostridia bacterium]|nr:hypothetical protein [Clostridia bacterium]
MKTRLEMYSKFTVKSGGAWCRFYESVLYRLCKKNGYSVYKTQTAYENNLCMGYISAVYQIFNANKKIVYQSENFAETMREFKYLTEFPNNEI